MANSTRTGDCTSAQGRARMQQAEAFLAAAELVLTDDDQAATPGVAAALAVLAGIAASDAVCCTKLRRRPRGQDHKDAVSLLQTVAPDGPAMAKDLARLLAAKDESHYGLTLVDRTKGRRMVGYARRMVERATDVMRG